MRSSRSLSGSSAHDEPLAYDARSLARLLDVCVRHIRRLDANGALPRPIRLGRAKRWPAEVIREWLLAGSPPRKQWEATQRVGKGRRQQ